MLENEKYLVTKAKQGEAASFGVLYDHYAPPIYRFIYLKISNRGEAQDLLHEVFLSAWQNIGGYDDRGLPFSSWLYQIARNRVIDYYRTFRTHADLETAELVVAPETDWLEKKLNLGKIKKALRQLTEDQQNLIIMRFINDLSPPEIAALLGKSEGAVRLAQHRALNHLRKIINEQENGT